AEAHLLDPGAAEDLQERALVLLDLDLHLAVVEPALAQEPAQLLAGVVLLAGGGGGAAARRPVGEGARPRRQEQVEQPLLGVLARARPHLVGLLVLDQLDRHLHQVAHDRVDVAADVADLGELGGLHLEERRAGQLGQPAGDLGLSDAGWADHDDVLRRVLLAQVALDLLPAPVVAQRHRDGALGLLLPDDVAVELGDDGRGGELRGVPGGHASISSITTLWLVYRQMSAAIFMAASAMPRASSDEWAWSARAAASANGPPEPIAHTPSSGSMMSPVPLSR